jgi:hypothetical protein
MNAGGVKLALLARMSRRRVAEAVWLAVRIGLGSTPSLLYACGGAEPSNGADGPSSGANASTTGVDAQAALPPNCTLGAPMPCLVDMLYPLEGTGCSDIDASPANCEALCGVERCRVTTPSAEVRSTISSPSGLILDCTTGGGTPCSASSGRRPAGLRNATFGSVGDEARRWLALAHLEAASVVAFERLADELSSHGAPEQLRVRALRSAGDEVRHARAMESLARRAGAPEARTPAVRVRAAGRRTLERIARENAVEGCVRETFGAALAGLAAECAGDARVRATLRRVARDETRHAELAWDVARWIEGKLQPSERRRVERARARAVERLGREVATPSRGVAGADRAAVFQALRASLWRGSLS